MITRLPRPGLKAEKENVAVYLVHNFCVVATGLSSFVRSLNDFSVLRVNILFNTFSIFYSIKTFFGFEFICLKVNYSLLLQSET